MDATIDYLSSHSVRMLKEGELRESSNSTVGASVGMLWLDVEGTQVWWDLWFGFAECGQWPYNFHLVLVEFNFRQRQLLVCHGSARKRARCELGYVEIPLMLFCSPSFIVVIDNVCRYLLQREPMEPYHGWIFCLLLFASVVSWPPTVRIFTMIVMTEIFLVGMPTTIWTHLFLIGTRSVAGPSPLSSNMLATNTSALLVLTKTTIKSVRLLPFLSSFRWNEIHSQNPPLYSFRLRLPYCILSILYSVEFFRILIMHIHFASTRSPYSIFWHLHPLCILTFDTLVCFWTNAWMPY